MIRVATFDVLTKINYKGEPIVCVKKLDNFNLLDEGLIKIYGDFARRRMPAMVLLVATVCACCSQMSRVDSTLPYLRSTIQLYFAKM